MQTIQKKLRIARASGEHVRERWRENKTTAQKVRRAFVHRLLNWCCSCNMNYGCCTLGCPPLRRSWWQHATCSRLYACTTQHLTACGGETLRHADVMEGKAVVTKTKDAVMKESVGSLGLGFACKHNGRMSKAPHALPQQPSAGGDTGALDVRVVSS